MSRKTKHVQNNPPASPHESSGDEETKNRRVFVEPGVQIDFVQDFREKYEASQRESTTHNKKVIWWTRAGAGLIFVYVLVTGWQACLTRQAIRETGKQFLLDQRPWLSPKKMPMNVLGPVASGTHVTQEVEVENTGKSPAIHSYTLSEVSAKVCPDVFPPPEGSGIPNLPGKPPYTLMTIFPGRSQTGEAYEWILDQRTVDNLQSGKCGFYAWGKIVYCDVAGSAHYQNYCWKWNREHPNAFDVCTTFNDGDQDHPDMPAQPCPKD